MIHLQWIKSIDNKWLDFSRLDLKQVSGQGVYVIWHGGPNPKVVRVGKGDLATRFLRHRQNSRLMWYATQGKLLITWAEVNSQAHQDGIETYLTRLLSPVLADHPANALPIQVRSPFG